MILILFGFVFVFAMMFVVAIVGTFAKGASAIVTVPWGWWMAYIAKAAAETETEAGRSARTQEPEYARTLPSSNVATAKELNDALEQCGGDLTKAVMLLAEQRGSRESPIVDT